MAQNNKFETWRMISCMEENLREHAPQWHKLSKKRIIISIRHPMYAKLQIKSNWYRNNKWKGAFIETGRKKMLVEALAF